MDLLLKQLTQFSAINFTNPVLDFRVLVGWTFVNDKGLGVWMF